MDAWQSPSRFSFESAFKLNQSLHDKATLNETPKKETMMSPTARIIPNSEIKPRKRNWPLEESKGVANKVNKAIKTIRTRTSSKNQDELLSRFHSNLAHYIEEHKVDVKLTGTKRFSGKSGDYYLKNIALRQSPGSSVKSPSKLNSKNGKVLTLSINTTKDLKSPEPHSGSDRLTARLPHDALTPIPLIEKTKVSSKYASTALSNAERYAVHIRRLEYSKGITRSKAVKKEEMIKLGKIMLIQNWWKALFAVIRIQCYFRGWDYRRRLYSVLESQEGLIEAVLSLEDRFNRFHMKSFLRRIKYLCFREKVMVIIRHIANCQLRRYFHKWLNMSKQKKISDKDKDNMKISKEVNNKVFAMLFSNLNEEAQGKDQTSEKEKDQGIAQKVHSEVFQTLIRHSKTTNVELEGSSLRELFSLCKKFTVWKCKASGRYITLLNALIHFKRRKKDDVSRGVNRLIELLRDKLKESLLRVSVYENKPDRRSSHSDKKILMLYEYKPHSATPRQRASKAISYSEQCLRSWSASKAKKSKGHIIQAVQKLSRMHKRHWFNAWKELLGHTERVIEQRKLKSTKAKHASRVDPKENQLKTANAGDKVNKRKEEVKSSLMNEITSTFQEVFDKGKDENENKGQFKGKDKGKDKSENKGKYKDKVNGRDKGRDKGKDKENKKKSLNRPFDNSSEEEEEIEDEDNSGSLFPLQNNPKNRKDTFNDNEEHPYTFEDDSISKSNNSIKSEQEEQRKDNREHIPIKSTTKRSFQPKTAIDEKKQVISPFSMNNPSKKPYEDEENSIKEKEKSPRSSSLFKKRSANSSISKDNDGMKEHQAIPTHDDSDGHYETSQQKIRKRNANPSTHNKLKKRNAQPVNEEEPIRTITLSNDIEYITPSHPFSTKHHPIKSSVNAPFNQHAINYSHRTPPNERNDLNLGNLLQRITNSKLKSKTMPSREELPLTDRDNTRKLSDLSQSPIQTQERVRTKSDTNVVQRYKALHFPHSPLARSRATSIDIALNPKLNSSKEYDNYVQPNPQQCLRNMISNENDIKRNQWTLSKQRRREESINSKGDANQPIQSTLNEEERDDTEEREESDSSQNSDSREMIGKAIKTIINTALDKTSPITTNFSTNKVYYPLISSKNNDLNKPKLSFFMVEEEQSQVETQSFKASHYQNQFFLIARMTCKLIIKKKLAYLSTLLIERATHPAFPYLRYYFNKWNKKPTLFNAFIPRLIQFKLLSLSAKKSIDEAGSLFVWFNQWKNNSIHSEEPQIQSESDNEISQLSNSLIKARAFTHSFILNRLRSQSRAEIAFNLWNCKAIKLSIAKRLKAFRRKYKFITLYLFYYHQLSNRKNMLIDYFFKWKHSPLNVYCANVINRKIQRVVIQKKIVRDYPSIDTSLLLNSFKQWSRAARPIQSKSSSRGGLISSKQIQLLTFTRNLHLIKLHSLLDSRRNEERAKANLTQLKLRDKLGHQLFLRRSIMRLDVLRGAFLLWSKRRGMKRNQLKANRRVQSSSLILQKIKENLLQRKQKCLRKWIEATLTPIKEIILLNTIVSYQMAKNTLIKGRNKTCSLVLKRKMRHWRRQKAIERLSQGSNIISFLLMKKTIAHWKLQKRKEEVSQGSTIIRKLMVIRSLNHWRIQKMKDVVSQGSNIIRKQMVRRLLNHLRLQRRKDEVSRGNNILCSSLLNRKLKQWGQQNTKQSIVNGRNTICSLLLNKKFNHWRLQKTKEQRLQGVTTINRLLLNRKLQRWRLQKQKKKEQSMKQIIKGRNTICFLISSRKLNQWKLQKRKEQFIEGRNKLCAVLVNRKLLHWKLASEAIRNHLSSLMQAIKRHNSKNVIHLLKQNRDHNLKHTYYQLWMTDILYHSIRVQLIHYRNAQIHFKLLMRIYYTHHLRININKWTDFSMRSALKEKKLHQCLMKNDRLFSLECRVCIWKRKTFKTKKAYPYMHLIKKLAMIRKEATKTQRRLCLFFSKAKTLNKRNRLLKGTIGKLHNNSLTLFLYRWMNQMASLRMIARVKKLGQLYKKRVFFSDLKSSSQLISKHKLINSGFQLIKRSTLRRFLGKEARNVLKAKRLHAILNLISQSKSFSQWRLNIIKLRHKRVSSFITLLQKSDKKKTIKRLRYFSLKNTILKSTALILGALSKSPFCILKDYQKSLQDRGYNVDSNNSKFRENISKLKEQMSVNEIVQGNPKKASKFNHKHSNSIANDTKSIQRSSINSAAFDKYHDWYSLVNHKKDDDTETVKVEGSIELNNLLNKQPLKEFNYNILSNSDVIDQTNNNRASQSLKSYGEYLTQLSNQLDDYHQTSHARLSIIKPISRAPKKKAKKPKALVLFQKAIKSAASSKFLQLLRQAALDFNHFSNLCYLVKITFLHKNSKKLTLMMKLIVKWKQLTLKSKGASKANEIVYRNMNRMHVKDTEVILGDSPSSYHSQVRQSLNNFTRQTQTFREERRVSVISRQVVSFSKEKKQISNE